MLDARITWLSVALLVVAYQGPLPAFGEESISPPFRQAPLVFEATLQTAKAGPVAKSFPPIYTFTLSFEAAEKPLRGTLPETLNFAFSSRTVDPPKFNVGARYIVASQLGEGARVVELRRATPEFLKQVKTSLLLPIGWEVRDGKVNSPWASRGEVAWPKELAPGTEMKCSASGRPALLAGEGIELKVEQVPPKHLQEFKNPFGDGQFKLTITNAGKMAVTIPALLKKGDEVLWNDSLVIICRNKAYVLPASSAARPTGFVELAPGESLSTTIDTLLLPDDVPWPRGGSRIAFTFAIGDVAADNFFYYFSNLHDEMRAKAQAVAAKTRQE